MNNRLDDLKVTKIIQEYTFLKIDEEFKKELINTYSDNFLEIVNSQLSQLDESELKVIDFESRSHSIKKIKPKIKVEELDKNTLVKLKKIYREIVKLTHPDKVESVDLIELYMQAQDAYEAYDLFELYFIAKELKLNFKLTLEENRILIDLIEFKKTEIKNIESSFIWIWLNSEDDIEKEKLITNFIKINYLK